MSIDNQLTVSVDKQQNELKEFRFNRKNIRAKCLGVGNTDFLDVDHNDCGDTATVKPYVETIFNYLQNREFAMQPLKSGFMSSNQELTPRMRYILVNWLVQVHYSYKMQPETLYLCVALMDRYLQACF